MVKYRMKTNHLNIGLNNISFKLFFIIFITLGTSCAIIMEDIASSKSFDEFDFETYEKVSNPEDLPDNLSGLVAPGMGCVGDDYNSGCIQDSSRPNRRLVAAGYNKKAMFCMVSIWWKIIRS